MLFKKLNFIYFTTINKQVLQLILISLVGTDVNTRGSLVWEEAGVPGENPRVQAGDRYTLSHTTTVDQGDRTRVAAVKSVCKECCLLCEKNIPPPYIVELYILN